MLHCLRDKGIGPQEDLVFGSFERGFCSDTCQDEVLIHLLGLLSRRTEVSQQKVCFQESRDFFQPAGGPETAVRPLGRVLDHLGIHRIVDDVTTVVEELFSLLNQP